MHLAQHLRMTGAVLADPDPEPPHTRVRIELGPRAAQRREQPGRGLCAWRSPTRDGSARGSCSWAARHWTLFLAARLGVEPFDEEFTAAHLRSVMRGRRTPVKALLLDQRRIAGVGNIYADEALFGAGIHPRRAAGALTLAQTTRLRETIIEALSAGIDSKGASIDDFRHVDGFRGSFQDRFMVHLREGEPCVNCGETIIKMVVAGRGTYVCEKCQPRPRLRRPKAPRGDRPRRPSGPH